MRLSNIAMTSLLVEMNVDKQKAGTHNCNYLNEKVSVYEASFGLSVLF